MLRVMIVAALSLCCSGCFLLLGSDEGSMKFSATPAQQDQPQTNLAAATKEIADWFIVKGFKKTEFEQDLQANEYTFHLVHKEYPDGYRVVDEYLLISPGPGGTILFDFNRIDDARVIFPKQEVQYWQNQLESALKTATGDSYKVVLVKNTAP